MLKNHLLVIGSLSMFFPGGLSALAIEPIEGETQACYLQLESSRQRVLTIKKLELLEVRAGKYDYPELGRPPQATHSFEFVVDGEGGGNLMNSPVLMKSISTDILTVCTKLGSVTFTANNSDWSEAYGKVQKISIEEFKCAEDLSYVPWGTEPCL